MARSPQRPETEQHTREKLLEAAGVVFSKKGFGGATVKEIAAEAGCNVSLISYHFDGKEGLFKALLEGFGRERLRDAEKILQPAESLEDMRAKLRLWMQQFLLCHVHDNGVCDILHRENILEQDFLWEIFQSTFFKTFGAMIRFFEGAKKAGLVRRDLDAQAAAVMLFGSLIHIARNQKLQKKLFNVSIADEKYRTQAVEQFLSILMNGVSGSPA
jgi:TetR/AcrR family transcriptional regulator